VYNEVVVNSGLTVIGYFEALLGQAMRNNSYTRSRVCEPLFKLRSLRFIEATSVLTAFFLTPPMWQQFIDKLLDIFN